MANAFVLLPGLMGSSLSYEGAPQLLWSGRLRDIFRSIVSDPGALRWTGVPARAELIERLINSRRIPLVRADIWGAILQTLERNRRVQGGPDVLKVGYDWRQPLEASAQSFSADLANFLDGLGPEREDVRITYITHSMGGLVLRVAIAQGLIPCDQVRRVIHIGSPIMGAPQAFYALHCPESLPFLQLALQFLRGAQSDRVLEILRETIRSFPSLYALLPPIGVPYIGVSDGSGYGPVQLVRNPLDADLRGGAFLSAELAENTNQTHELITVGGDRLSEEGVEVHCIFTGDHRTESTHQHYRLDGIEDIPDDYNIVEIFESSSGDGTVPAYSASAADYTHEVLNVTHMKMCNDEKVAGRIAELLSEDS